MNMEINIRNTFRKIFENHTDLGICKEITNDLMSTLSKVKSESDSNTGLIQHLITKIIRHKYQEILSKLLTKSSEEYKEFGLNITIYLVWLTEQEIIEHSSFLVIMEDMLETFPIKTVEVIFDILENNLKKKSNSNLSDNNRKLILLKISNTILKRLSSSMHTKFRGRVQMALTSIFPISDKSGVNQKGLYNLNNTLNLMNLQKEGDRNFLFYRQFWILHRYLTNPFMLFTSGNTSTIDDTEQLVLLDRNLAGTETILLDADVSYPKLDIFLNNIAKILDYFEENKIPGNEITESLLSYPKYLTSPDLFQLQLNDNSFRKTVMTQFLIVLKSFLRPISQVQKKYFVFIDKEKKRINELISKVKEINLLHNLNLMTEKVLADEEHWEKWKESACPTFEKFPTVEMNKLYDESEEKAKIHLNEAKLKIRVKPIFKIDNFNTYDFNKNFDVNLSELKEIKSNLVYSESLRGENPFIGNFIERVMKDSDLEMEIEEKDKIYNSDPTFRWKFLRLVSMNDISRLNNENVMKEYTERYRKHANKPQIKESNNVLEFINNNNNGVNNGANPNNGNNSSSVQSESIIILDEVVTKDLNKEANRESKFTRRKRSVDRSEGKSSVSYHEQNKKRKSELN